MPGYLAICQALMRMLKSDPNERCSAQEALEILAEDDSLFCADFAPDMCRDMEGKNKIRNK
jgi:hypothetical protein